ncbi:MAG: DUF1285 domain-containing protein [Candidatus Binatia bacterium]
MPHAGFYPIESHSIRFGRDGEWYSDGQRIDNRRIAQLFSRCVRKNPAGGFMLQMGDERAPLEVEDTPFVVRQVDGDPERGFRLLLNDETEEDLDPSTLRSGKDNAFTCRVKGGEYEARLLRPAYYRLAEWVKPAAGGTFLLRMRGREYPIAPRLEP